MLPKESPIVFPTVTSTFTRVTSTFTRVISTDTEAYQKVQGEAQKTKDSLLRW